MRFLQLGFTSPRKPKCRLCFFVYATRYSMCRAGNRIKVPKREGRMDSGTKGACFYTGHDLEKGWTSCVIFLNRKDMGAGNLSHEIFHAVIRFMDVVYPKRRIVDDQRRNEKAAWLMGEMTRQFWNWWYEEEEKDA